MRLLSFGGFATHGRCLEAIVAYQPNPALLAAAAGRPLCLAAHLSGADGVPIVWEGPRSRPVAVDEGGEQHVAAPLPVPVAAGHYSVAVEAVIDGVAWGSSLGDAVLPLGAERLAGGGVVLTVPYGWGEDLRWMVQYDAERLARLVSSSGLYLAGVEHYHYNGGWTGPVAPEALAAESYRSDEHSASAVACITLQRAPVAAAPAGLGRLLARADAAVRSVVHLASVQVAGAYGWWGWLWRRPARRWSG
ncbi:MAG: hypothetical protein EXR52_03710 [Dehalococcoidia bacterium]|nr:hypothetical protein [Dehalococcoidia bacterium]